MDIQDVFNDFSPDKVAQEICSVQPMNPNLIKDLEVALLPKHWQPKHEYLEMFKGFGKNYREKIIRKDDVREFILKGWHISRLSKVSPALVNQKWINAIIAMEK